MKNFIITSGKKYIDIDAYAGCIAYKILLTNLGYKTVAITSSSYNESISKIITDLGFDFDIYVPKLEDEYIILDVSNPDMFDRNVIMDRIVRIIDHHTGFENYWNEKGVKTEIEFIGSICTIIYEKYEKYNKLDVLDSKLCKLLIAGILDNTLNLKASITTKRDKNAYKKLMKLGNIDSEWTNEYFISCQKSIEKGLKQSIINDLKIEYINDYLPEVFGQLLVYDKLFILEQLELVRTVLRGYGNEWMLNIISLKDNKSYILAESKETRKKLEKLLNNKFKKDILILDKFMLRKEIMKLAREKL